MRSFLFRSKSRKEFAILASPAFVFLLVWALMLVSLRIQIAEVSFPGLLIPLLLFGLSLLGFVGGHILYYLFARHVNRKPAPFGYEVRLPQLRTITAIMFSVAIAIVLMNLVLYGLPPGAQLLAHSDEDIRGQYGKLEQLMGALLYCASLNSLLDPSKLRRFIYIGGSILVLVSYQTRGGLLVEIAEVLFAFVVLTDWPKARIAILALVLVVVAGAGFGSLGDVRESTGATRDEYLAIRPQFRSYPSSFIWIVAYLSTPISDVCWVVEQRPVTGPSIRFLDPLIPIFARQADVLPDPSGFTSLYLVDGVHSYLYEVYINFWYFGVVGLNLALGAVAAFFIDKRRSRHVLTFSVFMAYLALIFFVNYFLSLGTVLQFLFNSYVQRKTISEARGPRAASLLEEPADGSLSPDGIGAQRVKALMVNAPRHAERPTRGQQ